MNAALVPEKLRSITALVCVPLLALSLAGRNTTTARYIVNGQVITITIDHDAPGKRPSTPANLTVSAFDPAQFSLSWSPAEPASKSSILLYEIFRNGTSFATAAEPHFFIPYEATGARLEFFSVRAVDSRGRISTLSAEILAPRPASQVVLETKIAGGIRAKRGFVGLLDSTTFFTTAEYVHYESIFRSGIENTTYDDSLSYRRSLDPVTGSWSASVSGQHSESNYNPGIIIPATPYVYDSTTDTIFLGGALNWSFPQLDYYAQEFAQIEEKTNTEARRSFEAITPPDRKSELEQITLSREYTDSDLHAGVNADIAIALPHLDSLNWNEEFTVSYRKPIEPGSIFVGNFGRYPSASFDPEGRVAIPEERAGAGQYRYKVEAGAGSLALRWAEVFVPPRGGRGASPLLLSTRQELVRATLQPAYTSVVAVATPEDFGTIVPILLPPIAEIVPAPVPGDGMKFYIPDAMSVGQAAEIKLSDDLNSTIAGSMIVTVSGPENVIKLVLIDRDVEGSTGLAAAIAHGQEVPSGTDLASLPGNPGLPQSPFKLLAVGKSPGSAVIGIQFLSSPEAAVTRTLTVYPSAGLAVDANRDGEITVGNADNPDATSSTAPFRFWINDDADAGETGGTDFSDASKSEANFRDAMVNGTRDLIDFFPVFLDIKQVLSALPAGGAVRYKLKHADGALNCLYTNLTRTQAATYHKELLSTGFGDAFNQKPGIAGTHQISAEGFELSGEFLARASQGDGGVILVEGRAPTAAPLVLAIEREGITVAELTLHLRLSEVETMFRHLNLRSMANKYDGSPLFPRDPGPSTTLDDPGEPNPDATTNGKYFVFVHGYNVDADSARGWHSELFKRLWVAGSRARFVGVSWYGSTGLDYHKAVFHAFQMGDLLRDYLDLPASADVTVAAHSLGNMLVSHAIQFGGFTPARYYMINSAVPLEAYESGSVDAAQRSVMTEDSWKNRDARFYAANWHQLFSATPDDRRNELSWKNRYRDVPAKAYNFYSPGEDVVENPRSSSSNVTWPMLTNWNTTRGAWGYQEFVKGTHVFSSGGASLALERSQAGWNRNFIAYPTLPDPNDLSVLEQLKTQPLFEQFLESDLFRSEPAIASVKASDPKVSYDLLARGLPAVSYAAAANQIPALELNLRNFNMEDLGRKLNQWTSERHDDDNTKGRWLHNDFKNVALPYVFPLYEAMITKGSLK